MAVATNEHVVDWKHRALRVCHGHVPTIHEVESGDYGDILQHDLIELSASEMSPEGRGIEGATLFESLSESREHIMTP